MTGTSNGEHDLGRMPCANASNLAKTLVCLAWQLFGTPSVGDTLKAMTLRDSNYINDLILFENRLDFDGFLKQSMRKLHLVCN